MGVEFCQRLFLHLLIWFLSCNLLIWYITLIDFCILKNPCIPGINPAWLWYPLNCMESLGLQEDPVHPKGNQSWIFTGRTDAEAETPVLWVPDVKNWLIGKDPDAGKDWKQEQKGMREDEIGWHHQLDRHEFEQALGFGDGQGSLACCSLWCHKELDTTEQLNWTEHNTNNSPRITILVVSEYQ